MVPKRPFTITQDRKVPDFYFSKRLAKKWS
jgi:hypothetical protein